MWGYYDGYNAAQIELMAADAPITIFDSKDGKDERKYIDTEDVIEKTERWKHRYSDNANVNINISGLKLNK